jgi:hypothetical protein
MPIIVATQEAEAGGLVFKASPGKVSSLTSKTKYKQTKTELPVEPIFTLRRWAVNKKDTT